MLGLFSYTVLVRDMGLGRCILAASSALAIMILPFIEVRAEKAFREVPELMVQSAYLWVVPEPTPSAGWYFRPVEGK